MAKHFTDERWSDYVRGVLPDNQAAVISQHLNEGCEDCGEDFRLWRTVAETAANEVRNQAPESLLPVSEAAYSAWRQWYVIPRHARMARLLSDSLLAPLPAGVRTSASGQHRLLGRVGRWWLDLRFEPSAGKRIYLTGQVLGSGPQHVVPAGMVILLMSADAPMAKTEANQFGEFHLQFVQKTGLQMYVDIPGDRPIGIALPDLDSLPADADPASD
jgi:hypothetical protein